MIPYHIQKDLDYLRSIHQFRELKTYSQGIDFFSNDYLGLAQNLFKESHEILKYGASGSRLISGNHTLYTTLETYLETWFQNSALLYGSGYMANTGVLSCIPSRHDTILYDALCHSSLKDGIRLSLAQKYPFPHNDYDKLENLIKKSKGDVFVIIESVYSMDGDSPDPNVLKELVKKYGIYLIIDEAHSFGICSKEGKGWIAQNHLESYTFLSIFPLGKAAGVYGAFVISHKPVIQYLINHSRTLIYSTALPPLLVYSILDNLDKLRKAEQQRNYLLNLIKYFNNQWIYPVIIPGNDSCIHFAQTLQSEGFLVKPILSPTVPKGKERIRIVLHSFNTEEQVLKLKRFIDENLKTQIP